jgi:SAM-dependent methyltransferase
MGTVSSSETEMSVTADSRAFWDRQPCNVKHSAAVVGSRRYAVEVAARRYHVEPHIQDAAEFPRWQGKRVLVLGCGIGTDAIRFAQYGAQVTAVDFSSESLAVARKCAAGLVTTADILFIQGDIEHLSAVLMPQAFDLIWVFGVLHHLANPRAAVRELWKYMHFATEVRGMVYARWSWKNLMRHLHLSQPEAQKGCPIVHPYSRRSLRKLLVGLKVITRRAHHFRWKIKAYRQYRYEMAFPWRLLPRVIHRVFDRLLGWHLLFKGSLK